MAQLVFISVKLFIIDGHTLLIYVISWFVMY
jgi:hypothetical protein